MTAHSLIKTGYGETVMTTLLADPVAQVIATAEELLSRRAGATVTLAEPEDLGGSGPAIVIRVRAVQNPFALPKSMVIKQVPEGDPMPPCFVKWCRISSQIP
ncbi:hypothetical protein Isolate57596_28970 [Mycobacteroides abscessus subsp. abscessus]